VPKASLKAALREASRSQETDRFDDAAAQMVSDRDPTGVVQLPIDQVVPNPGQPRRAFDDQTLQELSASIREIGLLQPVIVRRVGRQRYELVAGERRWRAAGMAGMSSIAAVVRTMEDGETLEASLTENLQREDLSPMEEAVIFQRMIRELGYSIRRLADRLGKGKGYVEDRLRLTRMPQDLQEMVSGRPDTLTHAREIEKVTDVALRTKLIQQAQEGRPLTELRRQIARSAEPLATSTQPSGAGERAPASSVVVIADLPPVVIACRALRARAEAVIPPADPGQRESLRTELQATIDALTALMRRLDT
jgi:ParB family transcriptional regulator, chromosome partitioning protein